MSKLVKLSALEAEENIRNVLGSSPSGGTRRNKKLVGTTRAYLLA